MKALLHDQDIRDEAEAKVRAELEKRMAEIADKDAEIKSLKEQIEILKNK